MIIEREEQDPNARNPNSTTTLERLNEKARVEWCSRIEDSLIALLSFYNNKVDMKTQDRRHIRLLEEFDACTNPLIVAVGIKVDLDAEVVTVPPA